MTLDQILDRFYPLPESSRNALKAHIREISLPKGHLLLHADKVEPFIYFIRKGIVRAYADTPEQEVTFWFGQEGAPVISMKSYVEGKKGYEYVVLLEDCELYALHSPRLQELFLEDKHIANWGRRFAEQELIRTEERLIGLQFRSATERYKALLRDHPDLIRRVQLGYIASYLGITQVSLSRIRAELR